MPRRYSPREAVRVFQEQGFWHDRTEGSHFQMIDGKGHTVPIPLHHGEIDKGTFSSMLRQAGMTRREFEAIARRVL